MELRGCWPCTPNWPEIWAINHGSSMAKRPG
jgi:hypothetical protein